MTIYYLIYGIIPIIYLFTKPFANNAKLYFFVIYFLLLTIVGGFRGISVGSDTRTYSIVFNWLGNYSGNLFDYSNQYNYEIGYVFLNKIIYYISQNFQILLIIEMTLLNYSVYKLIQYFSKDWLMSVLVYVGFTYFFLSFNISRQFIAISISLLSLVYFAKGKKKIAICLILLAAIFHRSALLFLIIPLLSSIQFNKSKFNLLVIFNFIMLFPINMLITHVVMNNPHYSDSLNQDPELVGVAGILFTIGLAILFVFLYFSVDFQRINLIDRIMIISLLIILDLHILSLFSIYVGRIRYVYELLLIVVIPYALSKMKFQKIRILVLLLFYVIGFLFIYKLIPNNIFYGIDPYVLTNF